MCVAAPGKIEKIEGNIATVDYNSNKIKAHMGVIDAKVGDYVLVHAGLIIQVLKQKEAEEMISLFKDLEQL